MITALLIGAGALWLISRKHKSVSGIGAARKRRIYKELSLAQQAGVDFTKPYEDLTDEEIESLQRVSNETGYTETYYKSLQKAYNAISGIGETYDVVNANGDKVLTWIEDPEAQAAKAREVEEIKQRTLEAEKRAEESRKRLRKTRRSAEQMSLFGCGGIPTYSKSELDKYLNTFEIDELLVYLDDVNSKGEVCVGTADAHGGRSFYLNKKNYNYLRSYCLRNYIPIHLWNGEYWWSRNEKNIDGCGYADEIERELWEIWREQIEYGNTDYDYETWRRLVGEEYAPEVMRFSK